jgi:pimeloyl-ACP methyl ester carboxylesterase
MVLALSYPEKVRKLIVADIAPVTYGHTQMPLIEAMKSIDLSRVEKRSDADALLAERIEGDGVRAFLLQSLDIKARRWKLNLSTLAHEMDRIIGFPDINGQFDGPALFLAGADSDYVRPEYKPGIKAQFPAASFAKLKGAGHWLHADQPRSFESAIDHYLSA